MTTSNIAVSFASLVKNNNGFFKSEKQAAFLLDQTHSGTYMAFHKAFNSSSSTEYVCDDKGVLFVFKNNTVKGAPVQTKVFDRNDSSFANSVIDAKQSKHIKALHRDAKNMLESLFAYRPNDHFNSFNNTSMGKIRVLNNIIELLDGYGENTKAYSEKMAEFKFVEGVPTRSMYDCYHNALYRVEVIKKAAIASFSEDTSETNADKIIKCIGVENKIKALIENIE